MPNDYSVPSTPSRTYSDQWEGWRTFLGKPWKYFANAKEFIHTLSLKTIAEWYAYCKSGDKPDDIPSCPYKVYKEWSGWADWFGTEKIYRKTVDEWISFAERLSAENGGKLPSHKELRRLGINGLSVCLIRQPDKFSHIDRKWQETKPEEWIPIAKKLVEENGGVLPSRSELAKRGLSNLGSAISRHPDLFDDIEHGYITKTTSEWVTFAEELAKQNDDILPAYVELRKKYSGLCSCMRKHPEWFSHIKQDKPYEYRKSKEEYVEMAHTLANENGGILPSHTELKKKYSGLCFCIYKHPELFAEIKQKRSKRGPVKT